MAQWTHKQNKDVNRLTFRTDNLPKTKYSKTTQIISSTKDDDTGETLRTIWTENQQENNQLKPVYSITSLLTRFNMISITLLVLSIYGSVNSFDIDDLKINAPNYNVRNEFLPVSADDINYIQYGNGVVDNVVGFITDLGQWGSTAQNFWDNLTAFMGLDNDAVNYSTETRSFNTIYTQARWETLMASIGEWSQSKPNRNYDLYLLLTTAERNYFSTTDPKYWGGYYTNGTNKPADAENLPYFVIRTRRIHVFFTADWDNTYYLFKEIPSVLQHIRGL